MNDEHGLVVGAIGAGGGTTNQHHEVTAAAAAAITLASLVA